MNLGLKPVWVLIALPVRKWLMRNLNPMCPADQMIDHVVAINNLERAQ